MMNFRKWLYEDVRNQKESFINLFRSVFGEESTFQASEGGIKAIAPFAGRNIVATWIPGMNRRKAGDESQENDSYIKLDFFHLSNQGDEENPDYVGNIKQAGISPNTMDFTRGMLRFVKGLKNLGIHIFFDAVGMDRASSYATLLQKAGYQIGWHQGVRQMWIAHPVEGYGVTENPYADPEALRHQKQLRKAIGDAQQQSPIAFQSQAKI